MVLDGAEGAGFDDVDALGGCFFGERCRGGGLLLICFHEANLVAGLEEGRLFAVGIE